MKKRLISIACMLPFVIFLAIGKLPLLLICLLISLAAVYEFFNGFGHLEIKASKPVAFALILVLYILAFACISRAQNWELFESLLGMWLFISIMCTMLLILMDKNHNILGPTFTLVGVLYIAYMLMHIYLLEQKVHVLCWLPIIIACMSDTGGFFGGMYFGKHKLAPSLSPKKTVEGSIGGVILGTLSSIIFGLLFFRGHGMACLLMGLIGSVLAELGDLIASAFKRKMGIKDYSKLIPGHGGILDRVDSFILVVPFVYYYTILFII